MKAVTDMEEPTCSVPNCDRPVKSRGICGAHLQRIKRKGDVQAHIPLRGAQNTATTLWCSSCQTQKLHTDFHRNRATKSGYDGVCKDCVTERRRSQSVHRAIVRKAYVNRRRDEINAKKREAYHRNPEASTIAGREWRKNNPERTRAQIRAQNSARYARIKGAPGHATAEDIQARWDYYGGKCWICGDAATDTDHVKPLAKGGSNWPANLRPACRRCNRSKSAQWPFPLEVARGNTAALREVHPRPAESVTVH